MKRRRLGRTELSVSELGIGLARAAAHGERIIGRGIRTALDLGINYFDVAPHYSAGKDEEILGRALSDVRGDIVLATKVGYTEHPDDHRSSAGLMRQLEQSLSRLKTDYVDILQIHEADFRKWWADEPITPEEGMNSNGMLIRDDERYAFAVAPVARFLAAAREAGKARFIGVTGKDARQIARVVDALDIDTVMIAHQLNPIMRNAADFLLPETERRGLGVLVAAPLMRGMLAAPTHTRDDPPAWMDATFAKAYFDYLDLAAKEGIALSELTIRWLLGEQRQHSIVFGFRSSEDVTANIRAAMAGPLPQKLRKDIDALGIVHPLVFQGRTSL